MPTIPPFPSFKNRPPTTHRIRQRPPCTPNQPPPHSPRLPLSISRLSLVTSRPSLTQAPQSQPRLCHPAHPPNSHDSPVADFILWTLGNGRTTVPTTPQSRQHSPSPRPTLAPRQITAHLPKSQMHSPVRQHSIPHLRPTLAPHSPAHLPKSKNHSPVPDNTPSPRAQHRRQRNHSPSPKIPKITVQFRQPPSPDNTPSPRPTLAPHKSQPIPPNPKNHSSDNLQSSPDAPKRVS